MKKRHIWFKLLTATFAFGASLPLTAFGAGMGTIDITGKEGVEIQEILTDCFDGPGGSGTRDFDTVEITGEVFGFNDEITIGIPQGKTVIWKAELRSERPNQALEITSSNLGGGGSAGGGTFRMESGKIINTHATQGYGIYISGAVGAGKEGIKFVMNGGELTSQGGNALAIPADHEHAKITINGGLMASHYAGGAPYKPVIVTGASDTSIFLRGGVLYARLNENIATHPQVSNSGSAEVSWIHSYGTMPAVTGNETAMVGFGHPTVDRFLQGRSDHLFKGGAATKVKWDIENAKGGIRYATASGEGFVPIWEGDANVEEFDLTGLSVPTNIIYDAMAHPVTGSIVKPADVDAQIYYTGIGSTTYPKNTQAPSAAGIYKISVEGVAPADYENVAIMEELADRLEIKKKKIRVQAEDKTIHVGEALPQFSTQIDTGVNAEQTHTAEPVLSCPSFNGSVAGEYPILVDISGMGFGENYEGEAVAGKVIVLANPTPPSSGGTTPPSAGTPTPPPSSGGTTPPSSGGTTPPSAGTPTPPPSSGTPTPPPSSGGTTPPSAGTPTPPPSSGNTQNQGYRPPSSGSGSGGSGGGSRSGGSSGGGGGSAKRGKATTMVKIGDSTSGMNGSWIKDQIGWWYKNADGSYPKSAWKEVKQDKSSIWYYFDERGYMVTGWKEIEKQWYFFDASGAMLTGWQKSGELWYYLYESTSAEHVKGSMAKDTTIGGYHIDSSGAWVK